MSDDLYHQWICRDTLYEQTRGFMCGVSPCMVTTACDRPPDGCVYFCRRAEWRPYGDDNDTIRAK